MLARYRRAVVSTTLVAVALTVQALPAMLELQVNGKLKIKGGELNGAHVIIVADDARTVSLDDGLVHFTCALRLQTRYLFSFEQEGYTTKQVLFDTHVPVEYLARAPFEFPFQVTLERPPAGGSVEYVGPVGFVRFMPEREDFGYDLDYTMKSEQRMFERVREFRIAGMNLRQPLATVSTPSHFPAPVEALPAPIPSMEVHQAVPLSLNELPPARVPTAKVDRPASGPIKAAVPAFLPAPPPAPSLGLIPLSRTAPKTPGLPSNTEPAPAPHSTEGSFTTALVTDRTMASKFDDMREEELIIERARVTTVVHIVHAGEQVEYRRVANRFGPVFFFRNGLSCTARQYEVETERTRVRNE